MTTARRPHHEVKSPVGQRDAHRLAPAHGEGVRLEGSGVHLQGCLFTDAAPGWVEREQPAWRAWLDGAAAGVGSATSGAG